MTTDQYQETWAALRSAVDSFKLGHPLGDWVSVALRMANASDEIEVRVTLRTKDRDTGEATPLFHVSREPMRRFLGRSSGQIHLMLRDKIRDALTHELDESILIDGVRAFDPHKDEKS